MRIALNGIQTHIDKDVIIDWANKEPEERCYLKAYEVRSLNTIKARERYQKVEWTSELLEKVRARSDKQQQQQQQKEDRKKEKKSKNEK